MRRPLLVGLLAGGLALVMLVVVGAVLLVGAVQRAAAEDEYAEVVAIARGDLSEATGAMEDADAVLALAGDPLMPADPTATLATERDDLVALADDTDDLLNVDLDDLSTDEMRALREDVTDAAERLADGVDELAEAAESLTAATAETVPTLEATNFSAENAPVIALRAASTGLRDADLDGADLAVAVFLDAARSVQASHAEEIAEKSGPLLDARLATEAFARSLAGGVLLQFDWAPTVNGYGTGGSYGGTSYWVAADGGQATITLSDSVAATWPEAGVQALVVHEVGHAILSRADCNDLFFTSDLYAGSEEPWATAWAIGLGHTADGNGESLYGRPSDALIALSRECR